jgi:plastocyanin
MTARRVVILSALAIVLILVVTGIYYFVLPPAASATTVTIVATGGQGSVAFAPANFTIKEGQNVTLVFVNRGSAPHELEIPVLGVTMQPVNPGVTTRVSFVPDKVGTFVVWQPCGTTVGPIQGVPSPACNSFGWVTVLSP